jgi:hypothetical protein
MPVDHRRRSRAGLRLKQFAMASVPIWSLGFLVFVPFLNRAIVRRRTRDWAVFWAYCAGVAADLVLVSVGGPHGWEVNASGGLILGLIAVGSVHAFVAFQPAEVARWKVSASDPNELALEQARARMRRRVQARELAQANPVLAKELKIGRPDQPSQYDDGGLVDVNQVPGEVLRSSLGLTPEETAAVLTARELLGRFTSAEELSVYAMLPPDRLDALTDVMLFG